MSIERQVKKILKCYDGPWVGECLCLTGYRSIAACTAFFNIGEQRGRYTEDPLLGILRWEKDHGSECPI